MIVRTAQPASDELTEAVRWYEKQRSGLGGDFLDAVAATLSLIESKPQVESCWDEDGVRDLRAKVFLERHESCAKTFPRNAKCVPGP